MKYCKPTFATTLLLAVVALFTNGCGRSMLHHKITEGVIEYALTFPDYDPNGLMAGMLPEKTTLSFNENEQVAELSAGMGVFKTTLLAHTNEQAVDYSMSVMSKKMTARLHQRDLQLFNKESQALTILYTNETDTVAGYPCKKAVAIYNGIGQPEVDLWYTDAIQVSAPNWYGPYNDIPGVLLRYEMIQYGMRMKLDATSVKPGPVDPSKFAPKPDHQPVTPEVLHQELEEVLSSFSS